MKEYFPHDYNARNDRKLMKLKVYHKMTGIGIYWSLIEMLYEDSGKILLEDIIIISAELRTSPEIVESVIKDFELFQIDEKYFWSESVLKRIELRKEKSEKAKESIKKRWDKVKETQVLYETDTNVLQKNNDSNTIKEKKSINKKKSIKEKADAFSPPHLFEVKEYFIKNGYSEKSAIRAFEYYTSGGWKDARGNPVKNWKQKMIAVWFKDENEIPKQQKIVQSSIPM